MNIKSKFIIMLLLFILVFSTSAAFATENMEDNSDNILMESNSYNIEDNSPILSDSVDNTYNQTDDETIGSSISEEDTLNAEDNSYSRLVQRINEISAGGVLELDKNYQYQSAYDSAYVNGITINKAITIDGLGKYYIDGGGTAGGARIFYITSPNVVIQNLTLQNGYRPMIGSSATSQSHGGAIWYTTAANNALLMNCVFKNNKVYTTLSYNGGGGSIYWQGTTGFKAINCSFTGASRTDKVATRGGGIWLEGSNVNITNCTFRYMCTNQGHGGAILHSNNNNRSNIVIEHCKFLNSWHSDTQNAIYISATINIRIFNNTFDDWYARDGTIRFYGSANNIAPATIDIIGNTIMNSQSSWRSSLFFEQRTYEKIFIFNNTFKHLNSGQQNMYFYSNVDEGVVIVANNTFEDIWVRDWYAAALFVNVGFEKIIVCNNTFNNLSSEIWGAVSSNSPLYVENNTFNICRLWGTGDNEVVKGAAIYANNYTFIKNNTFTNSYYTGNPNVANGIIYVGENGYGYIDNNTFINNNVTQSISMHTGIIHNDGNNITISNNSFADSACTGAIGGSIYNGGDNVTITRNNFTGSLANTGGVIYSTGSNVNITYNNITDCYSEGDGGAFHIAGHNYDISNNYFNNIHAINYGVIYCNAEDSTLNNNTYINNYATDNGVLCIGSNIAINTQNFINNYVTDGQAGTIMIMGDNNSLKNINITNSNATFNGGSIYNKGNGNNLTSIIIKNTTSITGYGGAIYSIGDALNITSIEVYNSTANIDGGAIYISGANSEISYGQFDNISTINNGGVIFWSGAYGTLSHIDIGNSHAGGDGGAIYWSGANGIMDDLTIKNINASTGGAIYCVGFNSKLHGATFEDIRATGDGGAIYWTGNNANITGASFIRINSTSNGGAIFGTGVDSNLEDLSFEDVNATNNGGAINWGGVRSTLNNVTFINIRSGANGGALYFTGDKSSIKKATFKNIFSNANGGAVYWSGSSSNMTDVSFINCTARDMGGAVYWIGTSGNVSIASFINNSAENGGAILWNSANGELFKANFTNNNATGNGGAIYWIGDDAKMYDLNMTNNNASFKGGAINIIGNDASFNNFTLVDNHAGVDGGAIAMDGSQCEVINSVFTNNTARTNGGALYWAGVDGVLTNINFTNNTGGIGGALYWSANNADISEVRFVNNSANTAGALYMGGLTNSTLTKGTFINNTANTTGGAVYWAGSNGNLSDCVFEISKANNGGAIYWAGSNGNLDTLSFNDVYAIENAGILYISASNVNVSNSNFYNSKANDGGALYVVGSNVILKNADFNNNSVSENGGAIYWIGNGATIDNLNLTNNHADVDGGALYIVSYDANLNKIKVLNNNASNYGGGIYWGGTGNIANATFEFNKAFSGSAIYNGGTLNIENAVVLNNKANITSFELLINETSIAIKVVTILRGYDNFLNGIWTTSDNILVKNVTYWGVGGNNTSANAWIRPVDGVSESTLYFDSRLAGIPIQVDFERNGTSALNYAGTTDIYGMYNYSTSHKLSKGNYRVTATHPEDIYYTGYAYTENAGFGIPISKASVSTSREIYYDSDMFIRANVIVPNSEGDPIFEVGGKADVLIDGKYVGLTLDIEDGGASATFRLPEEYTVGIHNISIEFYDGYLYDGEEISPATSEPFFFNVIKNFLPSVVNITTTSPVFYVGEEFNITIVGPEKYQGGAIYVAGNKEGYFRFENGTYNIPSCYNEEGPVHVLIYLEGDDNFLPSSASYSFNIIKNDVTLKFDNATRSVLNSINVGDDAVIQINISNNDSTGNIIINIDGTDYAAPINGSYATLIVSNLNNGVHTIVASYEGDNKYNPSNPVTATLAVKKIDIESINVTADNKNIFVGDSVLLTINMSSTNSSRYPINGIVNVTVNNKNYEVYINDNIGYLTVSDLPAGNHGVNVFYGGDDQFNSKYVTVDDVVSVNKIDTSITISPINPTASVGDNVEFDITVQSDKYAVNDTLIVKVDNVEYSVPIINGKSYLNVSSLKYKSAPYNVSVSYRGNNQFNPSNATTSISVNKIDITKLTVELSDDTIYVGENIVLNINVTSEKNTVNGLASVIVNGIEFNASIVNGKGSLNIPGFSNGTYDVVVSYDGNEMFNAYGPVSSTINVKKADIDDIKINTNSPIYVGDDAVLNVNVTSKYYDFNGVITVKVNGREYNLTISDGIGSLNIPGLSNGTYGVFVSFAGNNKFNDFNKYSTLNVTSIYVNKIPTKVEMNDVNISVGNVAVIVARVNSTQATGNITFTVDNKQYSEGIIDGVAVLEVYNLNTSANPTITAKYSGDDAFTNSSTTANLFINKVSDRATVSVYDIDAGEIESVVIVLPSDITNGTITVKFNNTQLSPDEYEIRNNVIMFNKTVQTAGVYNVSVSVTGDSKYNNIDASSKFNVFKLTDYELSADIDDVIIGEKPVIKVILPPDAVSGNVIIDGVTYNVADAINGIVLPSRNKTGTYAVNVKYVNDNKYKDKSVNVQYKVLKAGSSVSIDIENVFVVGEDIHFTVRTVNSTGRIDVIINNNIYNPVNSTEYTITGGLANATYNVIVKLNGDNNYNGSETSEIIYVNKNSVTVTLDQITGTYNVDDNVIITARFNKNVSGNVIFNINGDNHTVNANNVDHISYTYVPKVNGTYTVNAIFSGDDKFNASSTASSVSFNVKKLPTTLIITTNPIYVGQDALINVEVRDNEATGSVNLTINNKKYNIVLNNGHGSISVSGLSNTTDNKIIAFYNGDNKYDVSSNESSISVSKIDISSIVLTPSNQLIYVGQDALFDVMIIPRANNYQINGFITATINNKEYNVSIVNSSGVLRVDGLSEGRYSLNASFLGDGIYNSYSVVDAANVTVNKVDINYINVQLAKPAIYVGEDAVMDITVNPKIEGYAVNGFVTVGIDNKYYNVSIKNNEGRLIVPGLKDGTYFVSVDYNGDNVFNSRSIPTAATITINKVPVSITVLPPSQNIYVGENATLNIEVASMVDNYTVNGYVSVFVNNVVYIVSIINNTGNLIISDLDNATYNVDVTYLGDNVFDYKYAMRTATISVNKIPTEIELNDININVGDTANIVASINNSAVTGNVIFIVDNKEYTVGIVDGKAYLNVSGLNTSANKTIVATYSGDYKFINSTTTSVLHISKVNSNASIIVHDITAGETENIIINLPNDITNGTIIVKFNDDEIGDYTINNNVITFNRTIQSSGEYYVSIAVNDDCKYNDFNNWSSFNVNKVAAENYSIIIDVNDTYVFEEIPLIISLPTDAKEQVLIMVDHDYEYVDVHNGIVEYTWDNLAYGNHSVVVVYTDDKYDDKLVSATIFVDKLNSNVSIINPIDPKVAHDILIEVIPTGSTGNITATINDKDYPVINNMINASDLLEGDYTVIVNLGEDDNYYASQAHSVFTVKRNDVSLKLNNITDDVYVDSNAVLHVDFSEIVSGDVIFNIGGMNYTVNIKDSNIAEYVWTPKKSGNIPVTVYYQGNDTYYPNISNDIIVNVVKNPVEITEIVINDIMVGDAENITVHFNVTDVTGVVFININGTSYESNVAGGLAFWNIPDLPAGDYEVNITYPGDDKYLEIYIPGFIFTVSKYSTPIVINVSDIMVYDDAIISISLPDEINDLIWINIADKSIHTPVVNGSVLLNISDLSAGEYIVNVNYDGNSKYLSNYSSASFTVSRYEAEFNVNISDNYWNDEEVIITTDLPEDATGNVTINLNDKIYNLPVINGSVNFNISELSPGNYNAIVTYSGDYKYDNSTYEQEFVVNLNEAILESNDIVKYYKGSQRLGVNLTNTRGDKLSNQTIYIVINGITYTRVTNENGYLSLPINLPSGEYEALITYNTSEIYSPITKIVNVNVLSTIVANDLIKVYRNASQYWAYFTDSEGNALANTTVTFNINGVFYNRTTNASGWAKLNINLPKGSYIITAYNTVTGETHSNTITVLSKITENYDMVKYYGDGKKFTVCIINDNGENAGAGVSVTFNINGVFYTRTTDSKGTAALNINLPEGVYIITTSYDGCVDSNTITVLNKGGV